MVRHAQTETTGEACLRTSSQLQTAHIDIPLTDVACLLSCLQHLEAPIVAAQAPTEAPAKTNGLAWFSQASKHIGEVELVQMYTQLDSQLRDAMSEVGAAACEAAHLGGGGEDDDAISTVRRLQQELTTLFLGIGQEDMQLLCISAPVRRDLLLSAAKQVGGVSRPMLMFCC